jgi:recombination protein RecT
VTNASAALERLNQTPEQKSITDLVIRQAPAIEAALRGSPIDPERFRRIVFTELRRNPALYACKPESLLGALMQAAQLGLEPGPLGWSYLVPYNRECTFIIGYKGMIELAYRSGRVKAVEAVAVYESEDWSGLRRTETGVHFAHVALPPSQRGAALCWYAYAKLTTGGTVANVIYPEDCEAARLRSPAGKKNLGPWQTDRPSMELKTAVRRLQSQMPQSPLFARALEVDERPVIELDAEGEVTLEDTEAPKGSGE